MARALIIPFCIVLLCAGIACGEELYIDEDIIIDNNGAAYIKGRTNLDILSVIEPKDEVIEGLTQELTLKHGLLWKFVYNTHQNLSGYTVNLFLPEFSEIQFIESSGNEAISIQDNRHLIEFEGENQPLDIEVGYVVPASAKKKKSNAGAYVLVISLFLLVAWGFYYFLRKKKAKNLKENKKASKELDEEKLKTIKLTLNENQLKILEALVEKKGEASQNALKHLTGIPKSSLSRNLELMSQKNIVSKFCSGTSNYIKIHPSLYRES